MIVLGAAILVVIEASPASTAEVAFSTTGAAGRAVYISNGNWILRATDTLTDGHCAQFQQRLPEGSWTWHGSQSCSGSEEAVGTGQSGVDHRICRTSVGNRSAIKTL